MNNTERNAIVRGHLGLEFDQSTQFENNEYFKLPESDRKIVESLCSVHHCSGGCGRTEVRSYVSKEDYLNIEKVKGKMSMRCTECEKEYQKKIDNNKQKIFQCTTCSTKQIGDSVCRFCERTTGRYHIMLEIKENIS